MKTGDLILIKSQKVFDDSLKSFLHKWNMPSWATAMAMGSAAPTVARASLPTGAPPAMATNKKTNKTIKLQYYGYGWKNISFPFIGIITEIIPEKDHDLDVFKIYHDDQYFYCRRMIIEGTMK